MIAGATAVALLSVAAANAGAQMTLVSVVGEGSDERAAKDDARRKALEKGAGVVIASSTVMRNFKLVEDIVVASARGVLVDESWGAPGSAGGATRIALTAKVSPEAVASASCTVLRGLEDPHVALIDGDPVERGRLSKLLGDGCMTVLVDTLRIHGGGLDLEERNGLRERGVDYVIILDPKATTAQMVSVETAEIVANAAGSAEVIADKVFATLASAWTQDLAQGSRVAVSLPSSTFSEARQVAAVASRLADAGLPDVDTRDGTARFLLRVHGGPKALAEKLDGAAVGDKKLSVTELGRIRLTLSLASSASAVP